MAALMTLASSTSMSLFDSGNDIFGFSQHENEFADPFDNTNLHHVIETFTNNEQDLTQVALINHKQIQYFDILEDTKAEDNSFIPTSILGHCINNVMVRHISTDINPTIKFTNKQQVWVQMVWASGVISWVKSPSMKLQNTLIIIQYAKQWNLLQHTDFVWVKTYDIPHHATQYLKSHNLTPQKTWLSEILKVKVSNLGYKSHKMPKIPTA